MMADIPNFGPLEHSAQWDGVEEQIKQLTIELLLGYVRAHERELNVFGSPHLGSFELVESFVKADGLAMIRGNSQEAMRYLFKAWRSRNPKRGLHFLRTYMQLLWPDGAHVYQLWQDKSARYPYALSKSEEISEENPSETHYLTSRVLIEVDDYNETGEGLASARRALRSVLGAKFLLLCRLLKSFRQEVGIFGAAQISHHASLSSELSFKSEVSECTDLGISATVGGFSIFSTSSTF